VKVSLRTHDPREAKRRQAKALDYLGDVWRSLRNGPRRLTQREVSGLANEAYLAAKARWEEDPGPATVWRKLAEINAGMDDAKTRREMAPFVRELLERKALNVDDESRDRLAFALRDMWRDAAALMQRRASNDYGPDKAPERARWEATGEVKKAGSISDLLGGWTAEAKAGGLSPKTIQEYSSVVRRFITFLGHDDAARVTPHDVVAWKDAQLAEGRSAKTVKDSYLYSLKSVFGWAERNHRLAVSPAKGITIKIGKKVRERSKGFTDSEATDLLTAALNYKGSSREHAKTAAAKHWLPILCAYTGARVGEMAQLRRKDVRKEGRYWVATITPEAGTVKNKQPRTVPLHPHIIALGFVAFVEKSGDGYLFLNVGRGEDPIGALRTVKNRVAEFARGTVSDKRVAPNHGWRHRFISLSRRHGLDQEKRRMITGHAGEGVDEDTYGDPEGLYEEICKLPQFV
jgi:integrase